LSREYGEFKDRIKEAKEREGHIFPMNFTVFSEMLYLQV